MRFKNYFYLEEMGLISGDCDFLVGLVDSYWHCRFAGSSINFVSVSLSFLRWTLVKKVFNILYTQYVDIFFFQHKTIDHKYYL